MVSCISDAAATVLGHENHKGAKMKNITKSLGFIAVIAIIGLLVSSCGLTGGTFELVNRTDGKITASAVAVSAGKMDSKNLEKNQKLTLILDEDCSVSWSWGKTGVLTLPNTGRATVEKGKKVVITAK